MAEWYYRRLSFWFWWRYARAWAWVWQWRADIGLSVRLSWWRIVRRIGGHR